MSLKDYGKLKISWAHVTEAAKHFNDLRCKQLLGALFHTTRRSPDLGQWAGMMFSLHAVLLFPSIVGKTVHRIKC